MHKLLTVLTVLLVIGGQCDSLMPAIDDNLFLKWQDYEDNIEGNTLIFWELIDYRSSTSFIPDISKSRMVFERADNIGLYTRLATWNEDRMTCFGMYAPLTNASETFVILTSVLTVPGFDPIHTDRRFISSSPDKYVIFVLCSGDRLVNGKCRDGLVGLSVQERLYDTDQDGVIDDIGLLPLEDMYTDAIQAFNEGIGTRFEFAWPPEAPYCPLPPSL